MKKLYLLFLFILIGGLLIFLREFLTPQSNEIKDETPPATTEETPEKIKISLVDISEVPEKNLLFKIVAASPMIISQLDKKRETIGTGFLIAQNGFILTDLHVVKQNRTVKIIFFKVAEHSDNVIVERLATTGAVIQWSDDADRDLALIKIDPEQIPDDVIPLELADNQALNKSQPLFRFGYNDGHNWAYGFFTPNRDDAPRAKILMPMSNGGSGGPIINMDGQVVGILQQGEDGRHKIIVTNGARRKTFVFPVTFFLPIEEINSFISRQPMHQHKKKSAH